MNVISLLHFDVKLCLVMFVSLFWLGVFGDDVVTMRSFGDVEF